MRILLNSTLFASALFLPITATLALMVCGFLYFPRYVEPVLAACLMEFLYRGEWGGIIGAPGFFTLSILALTAVAELMRMFLRMQTR